MASPKQDLPKRAQVRAGQRGRAVGSKVGPAPEDLLAARVIHDAIRAYRIGLGQEAIPTWDKAPKWMKTVTLEGVEFRRANPDAPDDALHERWMKSLQDVGWVWGPTKDPRRKTHPLLIPYADLDPVEHCKDRLFAGVLEALSMTPAAKKTRRKS